MKKILPILLLALLSLLVGCSTDGDNTIKPSIDGGHIASVSEQMDAIEASLPKLHNTATKARALVSEQISETRGDGDNGVKTMIEALEERVAALEEYIAGGGEGSWMDTTYATLDMYEETIALLAELQAEIDALKGQNDAQYEDVLDSIEESVNSMKAWVNELLTGYYDIATIDAMFAKLLEGLSAEDAAIRSEIEALRNELDKQFNDMEDAYRDAIREAIEENNGKLSEQLTKEIETVNSRIDDEVEELNRRIDDIEERLSQLEDSVSDILKRIQSITYIPLYDDNTARVLCPNEGLEGSTVQLDFTISPRDAAEDLAAVWQEAVSVKALYTGSPVMTDLPVVSCTAYADQGLLSVVAACDNLSWEFYNEDVKARAIMYISDGNNDLTSEYIPIIPQRSQIPNNQIWYTVTGKTPVDIQQGNGPKIVSNVYDQSKELYVVTFEQDVHSVLTKYFRGKSELKSVTLPGSVTNIEPEAFAGCDNLQEFKGALASEDGKYIIIDGKLCAFAGAGVTEYIIPDGVTSIGSYAFYGCNSLASVTIPNSVTSIGRCALYCSNLKSVYITDIAAWCQISFEDFLANPIDTANLYLNNELVTDLIIPDNATRIGNYAFNGYDNLTSVIIGNNVTSIGNEAFICCSNLTSVTIPDSVASIGNNVFEACSGLTSVTIGDGVTRIGNYAFFNCESLMGVTIGNSVKEIGESAFGDCVSLTSVTIPDSVTSIGDMAFCGCFGVKNLTMGNSVATIGVSAFDGCELTSVTIPESVISIGDMAFRGSTGELFINSNIIGNENENRYENWISSAHFTSITIGDSVTAIGDYAFYECHGLASVTIGKSVTSIGNYAFYGRNGLDSVTIPDSVTTIGERAFYGCNGLDSVTIGKSVTSIGNYAFYSCNSLTSVYCKATTPPALGSYVFDVYGSGRKIYVPTESVDAYKSATRWSEYASAIVGCDFDNEVVVE